MCMYVVFLITLIYKKLFILKSYIANNVSLNSNSYDCRNRYIHNTARGLCQGI